MRLKNLIGKSFDRLTVLRQAKNIGKYVAWECVCLCGRFVIVKSIHLSTGTTRSCGCMQKEKAAKLCCEKTKHGRSKTTEHKTWSGMIARCGQSKSYVGEHRYTSRGIKVCSQWLGDNGFQTFLDDMGKRPEDKTSIDRINNDLGYFKENCRWANHEQQQNNRSSNFAVEIDGVSMPLGHAKNLLNSVVSSDTIRKRLSNGWPAKLAITEAPSYSNKKLDLYKAE
jgi:hypothetical protein